MSNHPTPAEEARRNALVATFYAVGWLTGAAETGSDNPHLATDAMGKRVRYYVQRLASARGDDLIIAAGQIRSIRHALNTAMQPALDAWQQSCNAHHAQPGLVTERNAAVLAYVAAAKAYGYTDVEAVQEVRIRHEARCPQLHCRSVRII